MATDLNHIRLELAMFRQEMRDLVSTRAAQVARGEDIIATANRVFDKRAVPLGRRITSLECKLAEEAPSEAPITPAKKVDRRPDPGPDMDWEAEDIHHYQELRRKLRL